MGKLDDIRKLREANYERQQARQAVARVDSGNDRGSKTSRTPKPKSERVEAPVPVRVSDASEPKGFDRNAYQREYMREWRRKRTEELKRLRALSEAVK